MSFVADQEEAEAGQVPRWQLVEPLVLESADGSHCLHRFVGRWSGGDVGEWAVLTDRASGEALLDMAGIKSGKAWWRADGSLAVRLDGAREERLFIVDPAIQTFRQIGFDTEPRTIAQLQAAVEGAARQIGADGRPGSGTEDYIERAFSPDGDFMVEFLVQPQRMSHETRTPRLIDTANGDVLLTVSDSLFDASVTWRGPKQASFYFRHYVMGGGMSIEVDAERRTWSVPQQQSGDLPLADFSREMPKRFSRAAPAPAAAAKPAASYKAAFLVIIGTLFLMGGIAFTSWATYRPAKQQLTPIPQMPSSRR